MEIDEHMSDAGMLASQRRATMEAGEEEFALTGASMDGTSRNSRYAEAICAGLGGAFCRLRLLTRVACARPRTPVGTYG